jgi:hypothetical protein
MIAIFCHLFLSGKGRIGKPWPYMEMTQSQNTAIPEMMKCRYFPTIMSCESCEIGCNA